VESAKNAGKVAEDDTTKDAATKSLVFLHFKQQVFDTNHVRNMTHSYVYPNPVTILMTESCDRDSAIYVYAMGVSDETWHLMQFFWATGVCVVSVPCVCVTCVCARRTCAASVAI